MGLNVTSNCLVDLERVPLLWLPVERKLDLDVVRSFLVEHKGEGGTTKVEHTQLFTPLDFLTIHNGILAGGDLRHTNSDETNEADAEVVSFDEDELAGVGVGEVGE